MSLARGMLLAAMIRNPGTINLKLWPFAIHYAANMLNSTPTLSGFTPKEIFVEVKGDRNFCDHHTFGSQVFSLNLTTQRHNKSPT